VALPLWPLKFVIPFAGALMLIQGIVEFIRAIIAFRTRAWPQRLADVQETETALAQQEQL
jgi:TRAP-type mannitol/chloroaromatic compound transport system permease small subunit